MGKPIKNSINYFLNQIKNVLIGASVAENPAVATASGWKQDEDGNWVQKQDKDTKKLSKNLAVLSTTSPVLDILNLYKPLKANGVSLENLLKYKIGEGAGAIVLENTPNKVLKVIFNGYQRVKNHIPNTAKVERVGSTKENIPIYSQQKLNTSFNWNKVLKKLDKAMENKGFKIVNDPNVQYRAYRHNDIVIDDISPDNVGTTLFGKPKIIDFNFQTVPEWLEQGFKLRLGGKLSSFKYY